MATDLETGAAVIIAAGDLTTALRASMSAPGVFAPVERDGRLLVDGGLVKTCRSTWRVRWAWTC